MIFVDTSALYASLDRKDRDHAAAKKTLARLLEEREVLFTTNYVVLEAAALVQRRLGLDALRTFQADIVPSISVDWVGQSTHDAAAEAVLIANRRDLSLVDCVSFYVMRANGIERVFSLDGHFREQGFEVIP
ncbi:MAG: type II toxin-antitoxin system VapC family toxin [Acidobacteriota bacterium]